MVQDTVDFPEKVDVVVLGTGVPESIVTASLSRAGKKVLQIDRNDYYGGQWATLSFENLEKWIKHHGDEDKMCQVESSDLSEWVVPLAPANVSHVTVSSLIREQHLSDSATKDRCSVEESKSLHNGMNGGSSEGTVDSDAPECAAELAAKLEGTRIEADVSSLTVAQDAAGVPGAPPSDSAGLLSATDVARDALVEEPTASDVAVEHGADSTPRIVCQARVKGGTDVCLSDLRAMSRKFNLDLAPNLLYCNGPLVQAILKANISHYMEFRTVNRVLMYQEHEITEVPCSRAEVFNSTFLSMIEKRTLMKFLAFCVDYEAQADEYLAFKGKPFIEFLNSKRMSEKVVVFVIRSIAMVDDSTETETGLRETQKFLKSLGRFGKTPFLWPLFGVGELPQAFCRMSAVFGGIYCLRTNVDSLTVDASKNIVSAVSIGKKKIAADFVVAEESFVPRSLRTHPCNLVTCSRAILITNQSLKPSEEEYVTLLTIPPLRGRAHAVRIIELGPASCACPVGLFVLYLTSPSVLTAEEDLRPYVDLLTVNPGIRDDETQPPAVNAEDRKHLDGKPWLLWSLYYNQSSTPCSAYENLPENLYVTSAPDPVLGFSEAVSRAKAIFKSICPDEEFLLAVPNPEDIVWDSPGEDVSGGSREIVGVQDTEASKVVVMTVVSSATSISDSADDPTL